MPRTRPTAALANDHRVARYLLPLPVAGIGLSIYPTIVKTYVRTGKVRVEQRVLAFIGPDSVHGCSAALAAGEQNDRFDFSELLYFNQGTENTGWLDSDMVDNAAASVPGLKVPALLAAAGSSTVAKEASTADAQAKAAAVSSTPTILVGRTGSTPHVVKLSSPGDLATLKTAIQGALAG